MRKSSHIPFFVSSAQREKIERGIQECLGVFEEQYMDEYRKKITDLVMWRHFRFDHHIETSEFHYVGNSNLSERCYAEADL